MPSLHAILPILAIVLVAGCTNPPSSGAAGVIIESFEPDFSEIFSEETVKFRVKVTNTGSIDAGNAKITLLGLEEPDWTVPRKECETGKLLAPQQAFGTSGETQVCEFSATPTKVPPGIPVTYYATARVTYLYGSSFIKTINVGSQEELRRIQNLGGALPSETTSSTTSPVALNVVNRGPIRVFDDNVEFPLEITVNNVGGGVVCSGNCGNADWNKISIKTSIGGSVAGMGQDVCNRDLTLFKGQSNTIICKIKIKKPDVGIIQKAIKVESSYIYFYDVTVPIKVNPRP